MIDTLLQRVAYRRLTRLTNFLFSCYYTLLDGVLDLLTQLSRNDTNIVY